MTRDNRQSFVAAALAVFVIVPFAGFAAPVTIDQALLDKEFQLDGMD